MKYDNGTHGYILEVDLEYPKELHDLHSDYPLAPENMNVSADMVSEFSKDIYKLYHGGQNYTDEQSPTWILNVWISNEFCIVKWPQITYISSIRFKKGDPSAVPNHLFETP